MEQIKLFTRVKIYYFCAQSDQKGTVEDIFAKVIPLI